jgi:hypothetical protein
MYLDNSIQKLSTVLKDFSNWSCFTTKGGWGWELHIQCVLISHALKPYHLTSFIWCMLSEKVYQNNGYFCVALYREQKDVDFAMTSNNKCDTFSKKWTLIKVTLSIVQIMNIYHIDGRIFGKLENTSIRFVSLCYELSVVTALPWIIPGPLYVYSNLVKTSIFQQIKCSHNDYDFPSLFYEKSFKESYHLLLSEFRSTLDPSEGSQIGACHLGSQVQIPVIHSLW